MTWGEIQIISLQKMFAKDEPISVDDIDELMEDEDCKIYLNSMPAVANEAIQRIKANAMNEYKYNEETKQYERTKVPKITDETDPDFVLELPENACVLIPLYIASQLYKDDDVAQATAYRNEFEAGLDDLHFDIENQSCIKEVY